MLRKGLKKEGQVTLFIIFGILIVGAIVALFMILPKPETGEGLKKDPYRMVQKCLADKLNDALPLFQEQGGYFNPLDYIIYEDGRVAYYCYTSEKKEICLRNDALFKPRLEEEIRRKLANGVEECFNDLVESEGGYDVSLGQTDFSIEILPDTIIAKIKKEVVISRGGEEPVKYSNFDVSVNSPLFDFIRIANEILNQEVSCNCPDESCLADVVGLMRENRDYKITFSLGSRYETVYTLKDFYGTNVFNFAIKNCDKTL